MMTKLTLVPGQVTLTDLSRIYWDEVSVTLNHECHPAMMAAQAKIAAAAAGDVAVYGVNTGFGKLASVKIAAKDTFNAISFYHIVAVLVRQSRGVTHV
jgi:histidine ammonia-lyase